jgi:Zn-dependent protease with chaperone function
MFANYLYFILALLTYVISTGSKSNYTFAQSVLGSLMIILLYMVLTIISFKILEKKTESANFDNFDKYFGRLKTFLALSAVCFFGIAVHHFNPTHHINQLYLFKLFPTVSATLTLIVFIMMLVFLWTIENIYQRRVFSAGIPLRDYIQSNLSFPAVILVTWVILFLPNDIINVLPFEGLKSSFNSPMGNIIYSVLSFLFVLCLGPLLVQKILGCTSLEDGETRELIESLCESKNVKYSDIVTWPFFGGLMITAGVMGVIGRFRYILVTPALIKHLTKEELASVIAHEIGHVKHHHLPLYLFFLSGFFLIINLVMEPLISFFDIRSIEFIVVVMVVAFGLYFRFFFGYVMRNFERQADAFVLTIFPSADPIIQTFKKITYINRQPDDKPNWHHFSIKERIDFLTQADTDRSLITKQNKKVRKIIIPYLVVFLILGALNFNSIGNVNYDDHYKNYVMTYKVIQGDEIKIANALGDYYYKNNNYERTIKSYWKVIEVEPTNTHALNNLAWLYLTCAEKRFVDPEKALKLARRASTLKKSKEVMDTLAEALYRNKRYKEAVDASRASLKLSGNEEYYKKQLEKFERLANQIAI